MIINNGNGRALYALRRSSFYLFALAFVFEFFTCGQVLASSIGDASGTVNFSNSSKFNLAQGKKYEVTSTGKVINKSDDANIAGELAIENGTASSNETDVSTGTWHNHGTLKLYKNAKVTGDGKIINYAGFREDTENSEKANKEHETNEVLGTYSETDDSGYIANEDDLGTDNKYTAEKALKNKDALAQATYYDLVNGVGITQFKIYDGSRILTTDKDFNMNSALPDSYFVRVTDASRGTGEQGKVDDSVTITTLGERLNQTDTDEKTAYDMGSAARYSDRYEAVHTSEVPDEIRGSFYSIPGYTQYADRQKGKGPNDALPTGVEGGFYGTSEELETATKFKFNLKTYNSDGDETSDVSQVATQNYTPVYVPAVNEKLVMVKTMPDTDSHGKGPGETDYETGLKELLETTAETNEDHFVYKDWTHKDPVTTYSGDNSWFNGVYQLRRGAAIMTNEGSIFGGRIELGDASAYNSASGNGALALHKDIAAGVDVSDFLKTVQPTEFEWQGGAKDEYNRPDIYMNGYSTIYFNIQPGADNKRVFSFYGNLHGTETDRLIFEKGKVLIKGNLSQFKGSIALVQGAEYEIRSSDEGSSSEYKGEFPHANIYQIYGDGKNAGKLVKTADDGVTEVDTATMENATINNGHMKLTNTGNDADGKITLKEVKTSPSSLTELERESRIEDTEIHGVVVAKGNLTAKNTAIQGGVVVLEGNLKTENLEAGSTIVSWGNNSYGDKVEITNSGAEGTFKITDNHSLKFFADFNVEEKDGSDSSIYKSDRINANAAASVFSGEGIEIAGMNFKGTPTEALYKFLVYTSSTETDMPLNLGGTYGSTKVFNAYSDATFTTTTDGLTAISGVSGGDANDIKYTYNTASNKLPTETISGTDIDGVKYTRTIDFGGGNIYLVGTRSESVSSTDTKAYVYLSRMASSEGTAFNSDAVQAVTASTSAVGIGEALTDGGSLIDSCFDGADGMGVDGSDGIGGAGAYESGGTGTYGSGGISSSRSSGAGGAEAYESGETETYGSGGISSGRSSGTSAGRSGGAGGTDAYGSDGRGTSGSNGTRAGGTGSGSSNAASSSRSGQASKGGYTLSAPKPAKYNIWNRTFGEHSTIEMSGDHNAKLNGVGTMLGFDGEAKKLTSINAQFRPTVFAGIEHKNVKYSGTKYKSNGYFGGVKGALYNSKDAIEIFGLYELVKTSADMSSGRTKIKNHVFSLGTTYVHNFTLKPNLFLRPMLSLNYALVKTPSFNTGSNTSVHRVNNQHTFDVAPGLNLVRRFDRWSATAFATYHTRFGNKSKSTVNGTTSHPNSAKKQHLEYGVELGKTNLADTTRVALRLTRKTLGVKGFKASLTLGVKF